MHRVLKFAAVFALALLAFFGQLAALEFIVAPLVPAMEARGQPATIERTKSSPVMRLP